MEIPDKVRRGWEHRFPDLEGKWTHWKIMGDNSSLSIVHGSDLIGAIKVVSENYGKFASIKACRAHLDQEGVIIAEEKSLYEISRFEYDEKIRKPIRKDA